MKLMTLYRDKKKKHSVSFRITSTGNIISSHSSVFLIFYFPYFFSILRMGQNNAQNKVDFFFLPRIDTCL